MQVMRRRVLRNMNNERRNDDRHMMPKVVGVYVARMSSPPHVAPGVAAAVYV
jgi:hypothetical protein